MTLLVRVSTTWSSMEGVKCSVLNTLAFLASIYGLSADAVEMRIGCILAARDGCIKIMSVVQKIGQ